MEETLEEVDEEQVALEEAQAISKVVAREKAAAKESVLIESRVKRGEVLEKFLIRNKVEKKDRQTIIKAIRKYFSPRLIMPGHRFYFKKVKDSGDSSKENLEKIIFILSSTKKLVIERLESGDFAPTGPPIVLKTRAHYTHGTVKDSLYVAGMKAGLNAFLINQLIRIYSYSIDFQRAIRSGDTFEVLSMRPFDAETGYEGNGDISYAALFLKGGGFEDLSLCRTRW